MKSLSTFRPILVTLALFFASETSSCELHGRFSFFGTGVWEERETKVIPNEYLDNLARTRSVARSLYRIDSATRKATFFARDVQVNFQKDGEILLTFFDVQGNPLVVDRAKFRWDCIDGDLKTEYDADHRAEGGGAMTLGNVVLNNSGDLH